MQRHPGTIVGDDAGAVEQRDRDVTVSIPRCEQPSVSVIILAWRLGAPLVEAIKSVIASESAPPFEVIVVLNGASADVRRTFSAEVSGAIEISLEHNTGYGYACNRAASVARGEYLLFLNDDATLEPDALEVLLSSAQLGLGESKQKVGAVAAMLMNPDGTVQEAGSRILEDGGTVQLGAGLSLPDAADRGLLSRRPIDYGSGAALLVDAALFRRLGGHDPRYRPAYFEDVDLAFRMRASGHEVILEPAAVAVHAAGASTVDDRRFRDFAGDHAGRAFIARWGDVLVNAARADDPVDRICAVPTSSEPFDRAMPDEDPVEVAFDIARNYEHWLNEALDRCRDAHAELETDLTHARAEWQHWHDTAQEYGARSHELFLRLQNLEQRNLIGIARWRLGVARRRRLEKQSG